ncbi:hypothetical protein SNEBB_001530 [Seison nebaliae]|nr:hypothetical protein SNEBB_001530 [Seison nebaliae]
MTKSGNCFSFGRHRTKKKSFSNDDISPRFFPKKQRPPHLEKTMSRRASSENSSSTESELSRFTVTTTSKLDEVPVKTPRTLSSREFHVTPLDSMEGKKISNVNPLNYYDLNDSINIQDETIPINDSNDKLVKTSGTYSGISLKSSLRRSRHLSNDESSKIKEEIPQTIKRSISLNQMDQLTKENNQLKKEKKNLTTLIHNLQTVLSDKQTIEVSTKSKNFVGIPADGPIPIWNVDQKYLSPLVAEYNRQIEEKNEIISSGNKIINEEKELLMIYKKRNDELEVQMKQIYTPKLSKSFTNKSYNSVDSSVEIDHVRKKAEELMNENEMLTIKLQSESKQLEGHQYSWNQEKLFLNKTIDSQKNTINELQTKLNIYNKEKFENAENKMKLQNMISFEDYSRTVLDLQKKLQIVDHQKSCLKIENDADLYKLTEENSTLKSITEKDKKDLKRKSKIIQNFEIRLKDLEMRINKQNLVIHQKDSEKSEIIDELATLLDMNKSFKSENLELKKKNTESDRTNDLLKDECTLLEKKISELQEKISLIEKQSKENINQLECKQRSAVAEVTIRVREEEMRNRKLQFLLSEKEKKIQDLEMAYNSAMKEIECWSTNALRENKMLRNEMINTISNIYEEM